MGAVKLNGELVAPAPPARVTVDLTVALHEAILRTGASMVADKQRDPETMRILLQEIRRWYVARAAEETR